MCLFCGNSHLVLMTCHPAKMPVDLAFFLLFRCGTSSKLKKKNEHEIFLYQRCPFHDLGKYKDKENIWWNIPRDMDKDQMLSQVHG